MTNQAHRALNLFPFRIETFQISDLLVNITKHVLKPKHRVLSDHEKKNLLKKYSISEKQLPRMLKADAIARYYGLKKGQVVKITHSGEITGSHSYLVPQFLVINGLAFLILWTSVLFHVLPQ